MSTDPRFAALDALPAPARTAALKVVDQLTAPLDRRAIEKALGRAGITRAQRTVLLPALLELDLVAIMRRDD